MESGKLIGMLLLSFFFFIIGITGRLGSLLGSFIDPAQMQEIAATSSSSTTGTFTGYNAQVATTAQAALMISSVFGGYGQQAIAIANCESGMKSDAVNSTIVDGSQATGLFQILYPSTWNSTSYANGDPKDAMTNIRVAYEIFKRDGYSWREWSCAKKLGYS